MLEARAGVNLLCIRVRLVLTASSTAAVVLAELSLRCIYLTQLIAKGDFGGEGSERSAMSRGSWDYAGARGVGRCHVIICGSRIS